MLCARPQGLRQRGQLSPLGFQRRNRVARRLARLSIGRLFGQHGQQTLDQHDEALRRLTRVRRTRYSIAMPDSSTHGRLLLIGLDAADVFGRPRVAILSTGNEIVEPGTMDEAVERVVKGLTSSGVVSAASNRRAFRITQEPLDMFRNYFSVYAREQAYCHFSPALIANLEKYWNAASRKP